MINDKMVTSIKSLSFLYHTSSFGVLLWVVFITNLSSSFGYTCTTIPVSLSNLTNCDNNFCYFTQQADVAIDFYQGSMACVEFIPPDGGAKVSLNISIQDAYTMWTPDFMYLTDDPQIISSCFCGCPGGASVSCADNQHDNGFTSYDFCSVHSYPSSDCPLSSRSGFYSGSTHLTFGERFMIIKMKNSFTKSSDIQIDLSNSTFTLNYDGTPSYYADTNSTFNITVLSDTSFLVTRPEFTVYDRHDPSDFYFFSSEDVNNLDTYDSRKIGWLKVSENTLVDPALYSKILYSLDSCMHDSCTITYPWINIQDYLVDHKSSLSARVAPGSHLYFMGKPVYMFNKRAPLHDSIYHHQIQAGWFLESIVIGTRNIPLVVGVNHLGLPNKLTSHTVVAGNNLTLIAYGGKTHNFLTGQTIYYTKDLIWDCSMTPPGNVKMLIMWSTHQTHMTMQNVTAWGLALAEIDAVTQTWVQGSWNISTVDWRDKSCSVKSWTGYFGEYFPEKPPLNTTYLTLPLQNGVLDLLISFTNLKIAFEDTTIKPRMNSVNLINSTFVVNMQSITVGGTCYFYTFPSSIVIVQPVDLSVSSKDFEFEVNQNQFSGNILFGIRCHKYVSNITKFFSFNFDPTQQNFTTVTTNGGQFDFGNFLNWWDSWYGSSNGNRSWNGSILSWIYLILEIAIVVLLLSALLWFLVRFIIPMLSSSVSTFSNMIPLRKIKKERLYDKKFQ